MIVVSSAMQYSNSKKHCNIQLLILLLFLSGSMLFLSMNLEQAIFQTVGLLVVVASTGLWLITRLQRQIGDYRLQWLGYVWLAKLFLTLFLVYAAWIPWLDPASSYTWGYDPQRYYLNAQELVNNNFQMPVTLSLNFIGVLYYYGFFFFLLGHNPVIPALINVFATLIATLFLVQMGYMIKAKRALNDWCLGLALVLPEVLWYDVMTAKEPILMVLLTVFTLAVGSCFIASKRYFGFGMGAVVVITGVGIGLIRTSMLLPCGIVLLLLFLLFRKRSRKWLEAFLIIVMALLLFAIPIVSKKLGSCGFTYMNMIPKFTEGDGDILLKASTWGELSIGKLLVPANLMQAVFFTFPRALLYLIAPLPVFHFTSSGLINGQWSDWQQLMTTLSSLLSIALFPLALASLIQTISERQYGRKALLFHVPYWTIFLAIAGGNHIIHERYRVMAALLLWGCIWLGASCPKRLVRLSYLVWFFLLGGSALFYIFYKFRL